MWLIMKLTFFLTLVFTFQLSANSLAQKVNLDLRDASFKNIMVQIQQQTNYSFVAKEDLLRKARPVSIKLKGKAIVDALPLLFAGQPFTYQVNGKVITLREINATTAGSNAALREEAKQQQQVRGRVTNAKGEQLPGISIVLKGTAVGTSTDQDGRYALEVPTENSTLVFSALGYLSQEVPTQGKADISIVLQEQLRDLEEVVVVGYGTQLKRDLTGAVSKVDGDAIKNMPIRNAVEGLQGQSAGVQVTSTGGSPGTPPAVRIRGIGTVNDNNPLYVVDGLPQTDIGWLNPNDITSMEVLKDASATAIYGSRAANGVIMVTTAKGAQRSNELSNLISFDSYVGFQNPIKTYDMMNAKEFMEYKNLANVNAGLDPYFSEQNKAEVLKFLKTNTGSEEGTNWWKEINNKDAVVQSYDFAVSGGIKDLAYRTSFNYMDQEGIINGSDYDRMSWRTNFNHNLREWMTLSGNFGLISEGRGNVLEGSPGFNTAFIAFVADPISQVYRRDLQDIPGFLKDGFFLDKIDPNNPWSMYGPILMTNKENPVAQTDIYKNNRWKGIAIKAGGALDIKIMPWLKYRSSLGLDLGRSVSNYFQPKYYLNGNQFNNDATVGASNSLTNYYVWENTLTFEKQILDHKFSLMAGTSAEQWKGESSGASRQGLVSNDPSQWIIDAGSINPQASGTKWENALNSYFGRAFYSYKNRYMVTANLRHDGSSNFGNGKKWGTFPSVSAGWNFVEEPFMASMPWLDAGKLRLSWGMIGNQNISRGAYLTTYSGNMGYYLFGPRNPQLIGGSNYIGNAGIQWEQTEQLDVGLELAFLKNKLHFNFDYYKKTTDGMLLNVPLPAYLGFPNSPWSNAGGVQNSGLEFDIAYKDKVGEFGYTIAANASTVKNKVLSLGGGEPITGGGWISYTTTMTEEGKPIGYYYGFKTDGIFQSQAEVDGYVQEGARPGDLRFVDINKDGKINNLDRTDIGDPFPDLTYGFRLGADYKGFDLQILGQGTLGNDIMNIAKIDMKSGVGWYNAPKDLMAEAWSPTNPTNSQFKISAANQNNLQISDWLVEDGSYLRIKSVQLGYTLPDAWLQKARIQRLRVWAGAYNLFTFTKYTGLDPEIGSGSPLSMGVDQGYYPVAKSYMFGVNLSF
ncbi:SusC/RagA family TonB-linked outer membrane protein [Sphingobacterium psychroaquaticum]|nr:SusC/RagA family TonB-linked outer membrane protein [Sphingobacterium psychroaquaticum]